MRSRHHPSIKSIIVTPTPPLRISDRAKRGTVVGLISVQMSDGSQFNGKITISTHLIRVRNLLMSQLVLSRALTPTDDGVQTWTITATTADGQFSSQLVITATIAPPVAAEGPPVFSGWPTAVSLADNAAAGSLVASGSLLDSDGTPFNGTVSVGSAPLTFVA
jgi:hypothetical protein